ncbi:MurR/RpiR family transcriptional regulator [Pediococcus pentosaceus]|uniref:MurR/RpiR family transcriptional regulator n=1 Tax=Pediococcus pentosaceus TaxID=1255 RepID=UPI0003C338C2|nr:MurR/RpiR family transcriptional regulator [Pediococcus pentosaceus]AHA04448.1 phosphosugar-binding protein [Pediococcus pentosaceus SL4]KAF0521794.1 SIS domain-containing protein [Pediococcus pentosaceus]MCD5258049.1 MurR/RpiR family transcriptional regulator [Pediococcus pentosaceus]
MNFFDIVEPHLKMLTKNEQVLFDYVVSNMNKIKNQSIREVAGETYVSTATFLRFVKKIGFAGFSEFTTVIKYTVLNENTKKTEPTPFEVSQTDYREEYLKNIIESVRVIPIKKLHEITKKLSDHPTIYLFSKGVSKYAAEYVYYIYTMAGFNVKYPRDYDFRQIASKQVKPNDLVFILTYNGKNLEFVEMIKNWGNLEEKPFLISITEPDNNTIQNLSDINLYIFSDGIKVNNTEISSRVSTISLMELVLYQYIEDYGGRDFNFIKR